MTTFTEQMQERNENENGNTPAEQFVSDYGTHEEKENDMNLTSKDIAKLYELLKIFRVATLKEVERVVEGLPEIYGGYREDEESPILPFVSKQEVIQALSKVTGE